MTETCTQVLYARDVLVVPGPVSAPGSVTGAPATVWLDESDASYATVQGESDQFSGSDYSEARGLLDVLPSSVAPSTVTDITATVRAKIVGGGTGRNFYVDIPTTPARFGGAAVNETWPWPNDDGTYTLTASVNAPLLAFFGGSLESVAQALTSAKVLSIFAIGELNGAAATATVYEAWITVHYPCPVSGAWYVPPLRQYPRDDLRQWPPPRNTEGSRRVSQIP